MSKLGRTASEPATSSTCHLPPWKRKDRLRGLNSDCIGIVLRAGVPTSRESVAKAAWSTSDECTCRLPFTFEEKPTVRLHLPPRPWVLVLRESFLSLLPRFSSNLYHRSLHQSVHSPIATFCQQIFFFISLTVAPSLIELYFYFCVSTAFAPTHQLMCLCCFEIGDVDFLSAWRANVKSWPPIVNVTFGYGSIP